MFDSNQRLEDGRINYNHPEVRAAIDDLVMYGNDRSLILSTTLYIAAEFLQSPDFQEHNKEERRKLSQGIHAIIGTTNRAAELSKRLELE